MGKGKLLRFAELAEFPNVFQNHNQQEPRLLDCNGEEVKNKGGWAKNYFGNDLPIILELACGKGEYTVGMAKAKPNYNYIGVDIKGNRIHRGAKKALEEKLDNVAFLRTRIEQLDLFFAENEISEIWITFPDPFLRESRSKKRLTSSRFLSMYTSLLNEDGVVHLKTDSPELYAFTLESIEEEKWKLIHTNPDIYGTSYEESLLSIKTYYELKHLEAGKKITYTKFAP